MTNRVQFFHARTNRQNPRGGITFAMEVNDKEEVVAFAAALCHPKDNFNRKLGRMKAGGRLLSERYRTVFDGKEDNSPPKPLTEFYKFAQFMADGQPDE